MNPLNLFRSAHWVVFSVIFLLAVSFWLGGHWFGTKIQPTYQDPHRLNALKTFEPAIVLSPTDSAYQAPAIAALQEKFPCADQEMLKRLSGRLQVLDLKLRKRSSLGKNLRLDMGQWSLAGSDCMAVLNMTKWLSENNTLFADTVYWPGLRKNHYTTPMQVPESFFQQSSPWRGANGCVYIGPLADKRLLYWRERRSNQDSCPQMTAPEVEKAQIVGIGLASKSSNLTDLAWSLPSDLGTILSALNAIRIPSGHVYSLYTEQPTASGQAPSPDEQQSHGPNQINLYGHNNDVGFNVFLTLDPNIQALAQQWAHCYSGDDSVCKLLGITENDEPQKQAKTLFESAAVRMAAVVVVDVASGKIDALGSAHTQCYKQDHNDVKHGEECPNTPFRPRYDPDRLLNHALFTDALPASTIKPLMALSFLQDSPVYRTGQPLQRLSEDLKKSDSAAFLDRLFCGHKDDPMPHWQCQRPQRTQETARLLGWNLGCDENGAADCAELDVLFGRPAGKHHALGLPLLYARIFTEPPPNTDANEESLEDLLADASRQPSFRLLSDFNYTTDFAKDCSQKKWEACKGAGAKLSNEGWGQGNARVTPIGAAGVLARLAAAANGAKAQAYPHLLDHISDSKGKAFPLVLQRDAAPEAIAIDPALANLVLQGMTSHQQGGTAHSACMNVFGTKECNHITWIAGKTGTPTFTFDESKLASIAKTCPYTSKKPSAACNMIPYKWYVAAFKSKDAASAPYDKVIAVLTERNWTKPDGPVQGPRDSGVNISAELAFRIIKSLHPLPPPVKKGEDPRRGEKNLATKIPPNPALPKRVD